MLSSLRSLFSPAAREAQLTQHLEQLRQRLPVPVLWLLGKTQSGKTTLIRHLTGSTSAQIGQGFRPCTRHSRRYNFPSGEAPLLSFLDTRGLEEPDYDPQEDLAAFGNEAHAVIVTVKALDHGQEGVLGPLRAIRKAEPSRPVLLMLTCLHEAYPQQQHPTPYPYDRGEEALSAVPVDLRRSLDAQKQRFEGLCDAAVPIDLTPPEEGFDDPNHGGPQLKAALIEMLPAAYRQTIVALDQSTGELQDLFERMALPYIIAYSSLAAAAGVLPVPWIDLLILPGIQTRMVHEIAEVFGQDFDRKHFLELAGSLGMGMILRQATREVTKLIPFVGSVASGALAAASTFALGKAVCYYYGQVRQGHIPESKELRRYYREQLSLAEHHWGRQGGPLASQASKGGGA